MRYSSIILVLIFLTVSVTMISHALPRFALMAGAKCGSCHVNPTGGQMRNEYGSLFSVDAVPLRATKDEDFTFDPKISESITIGGDYRSQFIYDRASKLTTFQSMTTSLYGSVTLSKKVLFYFKQDIINGSYNGLYSGLYGGTEVYGLFKVLSGGWYIKGGSFLPDYGWKLDDHTAYTRGGDLGFTGVGFRPGLFFIPNYHDIGFEVGGSASNISLSAGLFNGSGQKTPIDFNADKAYAAKIEYIGTLSTLNVRVGVSSYGYKAYKVGGVHFGLAVGDLTLLGEMDWTHHYLNIYTPSYASPQVIENVHTMASYVELDYRLIQGLWIMGKFDMFDPRNGVSDDDTAPATNSVKRLTFGFEFFPYSFVEVRPQYRIVMEKPSISNDVALVQMHLWF